MMSVEDLWVIYAPAYDIGTIIFSLQAFLGRYLSPWGLYEILLILMSQMP